MLRIFIGYDPREVGAYRVCIDSLRRHASERIELHPVNSRLLGALYQRPESRRDGRLWDEVSQAPMATEFSIARFLVPHLARSGPALYCDCDFLWRADVAELFALADARYAVQVVKHLHDPAEGIKMDGQVQTAYDRKNWSSLMLWNCDDDGACELTPERVNTSRGLDLHQLAWLSDAEIGELPATWNWLEGVSAPIPEGPKAVHFTRGTPDMVGYEDAAYANEWRAYARGQAPA